MNETGEYYTLIKNWHTKASEEDYFAKFTFEYLAFSAYLRTQWKTEDEIRALKGHSGRVVDRDYIQALKQDSYLHDFWIDLAVRSSKDKELAKEMRKLTAFLKVEPLQSDGRWWNFQGFDLNQRQEKNKRAGILHTAADFGNLVEFWYSVRNNLFHGEKNPAIKRNQDLVRFAYVTLRFFVENALLAPNEIRRVYPASWDDFWYRFRKGEAEIKTKEDHTGAAGNIYECAFLEDYRYPILLLDKKLSRSDIVSIINEELFISGELAANQWSRLKTAGRHKPVEFMSAFGETMFLINQVHGLGLTP